MKKLIKRPGRERSVFFLNSEGCLVTQLFSYTFQDKSLKFSMYTANNYKGIEFLYSANGAKFVGIEKAIDLHFTVLVINDFNLM